MKLSKRKQAGNCSITELGGQPANNVPASGKICKFRNCLLHTHIIYSPSRRTLDHIDGYPMHAHLGKIESTEEPGGIDEFRYEYQTTKTARKELPSLE